MAHRHYGLRVSKSTSTDTRRGSLSLLNGTPLIWGVVTLVIVLSVILYGLAKTITEIASTTTPAEDTSGQGAPATAPAPSGVAR